MKKAPLSPHLQIYKLPLNALLSISHRLAGIILSLVFFSCVIVLTYLAMGEDTFANIAPLLNNQVFIVLLNLAVLVLIYHLVNGVRHLLMDHLIGLDKKQSYNTALITIVVTGGLFIGWVLL